MPSSSVPARAAAAPGHSSATEACGTTAPLGSRTRTRSSFGSAAASAAAWAAARRTSPAVGRRTSDLLAELVRGELGVVDQVARDRDLLVRLAVQGLAERVREQHAAGRLPFGE